MLSDEFFPLRRGGATAYGQSLERVGGCYLRRLGRTRRAVNQVSDRGVQRVLHNSMPVVVVHGCASPK
jgi:hypothetical protein